MANRNISATVQIGATMASSVGAVFGKLDKQINSLGGSLAKLKRQSGDITKLQAAQGKLAEAKAKGSTAATARYTAQVEKLSKALSEAGVDTSQLAKEQERLAQNIGRTEQQLGRFRRVGDAFSRLKTDAKAVGDAFGGLKEKLGGAFTRMGVAAGVLGGAIAGVGYLTAEFIDQGDALADQAEGLNMSTKALQTWQFAAGTVGIESEKLGSILSKLQSKISEGSDGTKESFAALGVSYSKLKKMKPEQQLTHITEAFARLPETVNKTALANDIFGKSGYKLLPVLSAGAAGLKEIYDQAKATGYILGDETNDSVNKADAAFNQFKLRLAGFKNQALAPLLPVFTDLIEQLGKIVEQHGPKFTKWIQTAGKGFMENLAPAIGAFVTNDLPPLIDNIGKVVTALVDTASWLASVTGGWDNLAITLVALNFAPVITNVASLGLALAAVTGPLAAVTFLLGGLYAALYDQQIVYDGVYEAINTMLGGLSSAKTAFIDFNANALAAVIIKSEQLKEGFNSLAEWGVNAALKIKDSFVSLINSAIDPLMGKLGSVFAWISGTSVGKWAGLGGKAEMPTTSLSSSIMPAENMPAAGATNNVKQDFQINVTAPSADPAAVGRAVKSGIQSMKLYDQTGTLVPQ